MGETTDQRSDIYSLGATIYYLATGRIPPEAVLRVSSGKELATPTALNPLLPAELDGFLGKCLAVRQDDRFSSMAHVREALLAVPSGTSSQASNPTIPVVATASPVSTPRPAITVEMFPVHSKKDYSSKLTLGLAVGALVAAMVLTVVTLGLNSGARDKVTVAETKPIPEARQTPAPKVESQISREQGSEDRPEPQVPRLTFTRTPLHRETAASQGQAAQPSSSESPARTTAKPSIDSAPSLGAAPSYPKAAAKPQAAKPAEEVVERPAAPSYPVVAARPDPQTKPSPRQPMVGQGGRMRPGQRLRNGELPPRPGILRPGMGQ